MPVVVSAATTVIAGGVLGGFQTVQQVNGLTVSLSDLKEGIKGLKTDVRDLRTDLRDLNVKFDRNFGALVEEREAIARLAGEVSVLRGK